MRNTPSRVDILRAAHAVGKLHNRVEFWDKEGITKLHLSLAEKYVNAKSDKAAERLLAVARGLTEIHFPSPVREYTTALEWRRKGTEGGAWYRWTLADDVPVEFRRLNPQPPAPVL